MTGEPTVEPHGSCRTRDTFRELRREPCPVCRHAGRCKANSSRDVILCFRETAESADGFRRIKQTGECVTYVRTGSPADHRNAPQSKGDWGRKANNYATALSDDRALALAEQLHVIPETLKRVGAGWSRHLHAYTFPERDARGCVIGIATRRPSDGAKKALWP